MIGEKAPNLRLRDENEKITKITLSNFLFKNELIILSRKIKFKYLYKCYG